MRGNGETTRIAGASRRFEIVPHWWRGECDAQRRDFLAHRMGKGLLARRGRAQRPGNPNARPARRGRETRRRARQIPALRALRPAARGWTITTGPSRTGLGSTNGACNEIIAGGGRPREVIRGISGSNGPALSGPRLSKGRPGRITASTGQPPELPAFHSIFSSTEVYADVPIPDRLDSL